MASRTPQSARGFSSAGAPWSGTCATFSPNSESDPAGSWGAPLRFPSAVQLSDDIEALTYRVAQEAIRNAKSHDAPTEVAVCVESESRQAVLSVVDNGRGFLAEVEKPGVSDGHFGLQLMRDLVDHAGGRLTVISTPGEGTSVRVTVLLR